MLHQLPPELLLYIAQENHDTITLLALALTHRCFRGIVRERLLLNARVPLRSIPHYVVLISRHPKWAESIKLIELCDDTPELKSIPYSVPAMEACRKLISTIPLADARTAFEHALQLYHASPVVWTAMLFLALPSAVALRLKLRSDDMPVAYEFVLREYTRGSSAGDPLSRLELFVLKRVVVLDVFAPNELCDPIAVSHLSNLHTLVVDGPCLRPHTLHGIGTHGAAVLAATRPPGSIPAQLDTLSIRGGVESMPWEWLAELQWHQMRDQWVARRFTDLKVRMYFTVPYDVVERGVLQRPKLEALEAVNVEMILTSWAFMEAGFKTFFRVKNGRGADVEGEEEHEYRLFGEPARNYR